MLDYLSIVCYIFLHTAWRIPSLNAARRSIDGLNAAFELQRRHSGKTRLRLRFDFNNKLHRPPCYNGINHEVEHSEILCVRLLELRR